MFWSWIREKVKAAVLAGVADAAGELDGTGEGDTAQAVALLRTRLALALPGPVAPVTAKDNGQAVATGPARKRRAERQKKRRAWGSP
jgi:hypothetical protein